MAKRRLAYDFTGVSWPKHERIPVDELTVLDHAQRMLKPDHVRYMRKTFEIKMIGTLLGSRQRDGSVGIFDGQHRLQMVKEEIADCQEKLDDALRVGDGDAIRDLNRRISAMQNLAVDVYENMTPEQEAMAFLLKNREASPPNAVDQFVVGVNAGMSPYVEIDEELARRNLVVGRQGKDRRTGKLAPTGNRVTSITPYVDAILKFPENGIEALRKALDVADMVWGEGRNSGRGRIQATWEGSLIGGLIRLFAIHGDVPKVTTRRVADAIANYRPSTGPKLPQGSDTRDPATWQRMIADLARAASGHSASSLSKPGVAYRTFADEVWKSHEERTVRDESKRVFLAINPKGESK